MERSGYSSFFSPWPAADNPACDLVISWTMAAGREAFARAVSQDHRTWARARGWALWKALICLALYVDTDTDQAAGHRKVIDEVLADHDRMG